MAQEEINKVVGDSFEDLKVEEMTDIQGAGDVDAETTPVISATIVSASASFEVSVRVTKTCNGHCGNSL